MTNIRRASALATAALLLGALTACDGEAAEPASTQTPAQTPSPSTSTADPRPTDTEVAKEAVSTTVRQYFAVVDRLRQDSGASLKQLRSVAMGGQLTAQEVFTRNQRDAGNRQVGDTKIVEVVVQQLNLASSASSDTESPTAQIDVCWDVAEVDVLDDQGQSIVTADRPERGWTRYTLTNKRAELPFDVGWRVSNGVDLEKSPCTAA